MRRSICKIMDVIGTKYIIKSGILFLILLLFIPCIAAEITQAASENKKPEYSRGEIIIKFKSKEQLETEVNSFITQGQFVEASRINPNISNGLRTAVQSAPDFILRGNQIKKIADISELVKSVVNTDTILEPVFKALHKQMRFKGKTEQQIDLQVKQDNLFNVYILRGIETKDETIPEICAGIAAEDLNIEYAEPNYIYHADYAPNDARYPEQWAHQKMMSEQGWDIETGSQGVTIAILDTGVDYNHEDLKTNIWINPNEISDNGIDDDDNGYIDDIRGWNFVSKNNDPLDDYGHGTHCAGIAAAIGNNSIGVSGLASKCRIMVLKAGNAAGSFNLNECVNAVKYAADNGAYIISNSWGGYNYSSLLDAAFEYAASCEKFRTGGVVLVAAAGNDSIDTPHYPSSYPSVLSVAAAAKDDTRAGFSNYGIDVDVAAPGVSILSTLIGNNYGNKSGTSMAAPYVAGLAGLIFSRNPQLTKEEVDFILINKVDEFGVDIPAPDKLIGKGRINVLKALQFGSMPLYDARIISPAGGRISLTQDITGKANGDSYVLQIGEGYYPSEWEVIAAGEQDQNGYMGNVNTVFLKDEIYTIKLIVNGVNGEVTDQVQVEIDNVFIEEPNSAGFYAYGEVIPVRAVLKHNSESYSLEYSFDAVPEVWVSLGLEYSLNGNILSGTFDTRCLPDEGICKFRVKSTFNGVESEDITQCGIDRYQKGWPRIVSGKIDRSSPMAADINNDGYKEVIIGTTTGKVYVWDYKGCLLNGWPVDTGAAIRATAAIANIDADDELEIIINSAGKLYALNYDGSIVNGWPRSIGAAFSSSPVIYDLNGDKKILVGLTNPVGLKMLNSDGTDYAGFTNNVKEYVFASAAYADIDKTNPGNEIVVHSTTGGIAPKSYVYLLRPDGTILPDWPREFNDRVDISPVICDINDDGQKEIIVVPETNRIYAFDYLGNILPGKWPVTTMEVHYAPALCLGNFNGKTKLLVHHSTLNQLYAIDYKGSLSLAGRLSESSEYSGAVIGDIDGDMSSEALIGTYDSKLFAFNEDGSILNKWPKLTWGKISTVPAIEDIDNDKDTEVIIASYEGVVYIFDLPAAYNARNIDWPMYQHDLMHTGDFQSNVTEGNTAPAVEAGPDITISLTHQANLLSAVKDDGLPHGTVNVLWCKVSGPGNVEFSDAAALNTTAAFSQEGIYILRVSADDGELKGYDYMVVVVNPVSVMHAPVIAPMSNQLVKPGKYVYLYVKAADQDIGDSITYSYISLDETISAAIHPTTGYFYWYVSEDQIGTHTIVLLAADKSGLQDSETITITVADNIAPVLDPIGNKKVREGEVLKFKVTGSDADGDLLTYTAAGLPQGADFDSQTGEFSWTPAYEQSGNYDITFSVSDTKLTNSEKITITVNNITKSPLLVILLDFADNDMSDVVKEPEKAWSGLIFGTEKGQGNHYWNEVSRGQFQLLKANEAYGEVNNGVIRVKLSQNKPVSGKYIVEQQSWIPEALDIAGNYINFAEYDVNKDMVLSNKELAILFVLNLPYENISGAGAQANTLINHVVNGIKIQKFIRVQYDYTSIGVNMHELAHHIFNLSHFVWPSQHGLMGVGAYNKDPVITKLHNSDHWGTSPAHLIGYNKIICNFVQPANITSTTYNVKLYSPHTDDYNVIALPVAKGYLYLENRTKEGYDQAIPFINDNGGLFATDVSQYITPLRLSIDCGNLGDYYSYKGHNDGFSLGGCTITNISEPGPVMTLDIIYTGIIPGIEKYKYRYWINDPEREGYRIWQYTDAKEGRIVDIDFSLFPSGDDPKGYFTINLEAYYNTGEVRSANLEAQWTTSAKYLKINKAKISNPYTYADDAIINLSFNEGESYDQSAIVSVNHNGFQAEFRLINLPKYAVDIKGDINEDGKVDVLDVQLCVNVVLGVVEDPDKKADVNGDKIVNVLDVQKLVNLILGVQEG